MVNMQEQINGKQAAGESAAAEAVSAHPKRPDVQRITQTDTESNRAAIGKEQKERELLREEEEKYRKQQRRQEGNERFLRFGAAGIIYALFYTFCLYRNTAGITYPFFVAGTFWFYCFCMKRSEVPLKSGAIFYMGTAFLLGIASCLSGDGRMLFWNRVGISLLVIGFLLHQYYEDAAWSFMYYLGALGRTAGGFVRELLTPWQDLLSYRHMQKEKMGQKESRITYVLAGIALAVPLLFLVILLLSSADRMFSHVFTEEIVRRLLRMEWPRHIFGVAWTLFLGFGTGYGLIVFLNKRTLPAQKEGRAQAEALTAITAASLLAVVYLLFCGVQIVGLFLGRVSLPEGYTYAGYARAGFFQLLFVCFLNLALVLSCLAYFRKNRLLQIILTVISLCTYVMIASSAMRMLLYIRCYYLTFLRILVLWALALLAVLMAGVMLRIYKEGFGLFRYSMAVVSLFYLALSLARPDYIIARCNVNALYAYEKQEECFFSLENEPDLGYLYELSSDAAPVLYGLQKNYYAEDYYWEECREAAQDVSLRSFNLSVYRAGRYAEKRK